MSSSPYKGLESRAFWSSGVAEQSPLAMDDLYRRKFRMRKHEAIATAGSCFAQHIARHLKARAFNVMQMEPAPQGLSDADAKAQSFGIYTCRYGNIYTAAQLLQLAREALDGHEPAEPIWEKDGRFYDAQRPGVEPKGWATEEEVRAARHFHLRNVAEMFLSMDVFVFTFGLTEAWIHRETGTVYPTAPGTIAGQFDPEVYEFKNYTHSETLRAFNSFLKLMKTHRKRRLKCIITVSPVPLTATASDDHVLAASTYSKSVLRGVCGELSQSNRHIDYYPSYELITAPSSRGIFYERNLRSVSAPGVENAMRVFINQHDPSGGAVKPAPAPTAPARASKAEERDQAADDLVCEEVLLEAFNK
ncbi:GSCFA domain-containing protein [Planktotalea sp.]|uniref:GSCFA domain-containing protein n=1 Tax=Planktotalea sp. TaxID=2029877 RepID=UPI0032978C36